jgi:hypothetical protein
VPEAHDDVDAVLVTDGLVRPKMDSLGLSLADLNDSVVAAPAVRMDDSIISDSAAADGLLRSLCSPAQPPHKDVSSLPRRLARRGVIGETRCGGRAPSAPKKLGRQSNGLLQVNLVGD